MCGAVSSGCCDDPTCVDEEEREKELSALREGRTGSSSRWERKNAAAKACWNTGKGG